MADTVFPDVVLLAVLLEVADRCRVRPGSFDYLGGFALRPPWTLESLSHLTIIQLALWTGPILCTSYQALLWVICHIAC